MASSSSSTSAAAAAGTTYQVFLSFRGPDTRQGFTDVLYHALVDAGVRVFRDNEEIRKGEEIGEEILRAIEESSIFVPIFSGGYASSKWCLIEFTKMVELKEGSSGKKIIPIFYDVGVDDVKLRTDLYSKALEEHSEKYGAKTVRPWAEALRQAGKFKGWELKDQGHAEFAKLVVRDISMKLRVKHKYVTEYLVRRDDQEEALMKLIDIESSDVLFVGIYGMGGIGKTTLAQVVFNKLCDRFDGCSFLANVRESSGQPKGIEILQKQLLQNLGIKSKDIVDVHDGMNRLRETLARKNVLIVLDDVDCKEQILNLAGDASWFGPGSRILITTRDQSVFEVRRLGIQTLEIEELKPEEASRLFCMHAFQKDSPPDDYLNLSEEAVQSTGGLPLALAIIGSLLGDKPPQEWDGIIERLKKVPHKDVQKQLMISYEALSHGTKQIFLDIASFFIGKEKTYPIYMWQACGFDPEVGLKELVYMSLLKVTVEERAYMSGVKRKKFWMHDQLRDLGRNIVCDESSEDDIKPSRIWIHADALKMLQEEEGKENVEMIRLRYYDDPATGYSFTKRDLSRFEKLRYFACSSRGFSESWKSIMIPNKLRGISLHKYPPLFPKLRWLHWPSFPPKFWRVEFYWRNLVILELSNSDIDENWRGWKQFGVGSPLKVLDLSGCRRLKRTPDLSVFSSLERLILADCISLVQINSSISVMKSLVELDLSCTDVGELPDTIGQLVKLEVLSLRRCESLTKLPSTIGNMTSLVKLDLSFSGITELPDSIGNLRSLVKLDLSRYGIIELPDSIGNLRSLVKLDLSRYGIIELPDSIRNLRSLVKLALSYSGITALPDSIGNLRSLVELDLSHTWITELPDSIGNLENLRVINICRTKIKELPSSFGMLKRLEELHASWTPLEEIPSNTIEGLTCLRVLKKLIDDRDQEGPREAQAIKLEGIGKLRRLVELEVDLLNVTCIPGEFSSLAQLQKLNLGCPNLQLCPPLPPTLSYLSLRGVGEKTQLPRLSHLKNLSTLKFLRCWLREDIVRDLGLGELGSLTSVSLFKCEFGNLDGFRLPANLQKLR